MDKELKRKAEYILKKHAMGWTSIYNEQNKTDYTVRAVEKEQCEKELSELGFDYKAIIIDEDETFTTYLI
jgi:hypothetical protein